MPNSEISQQARELLAAEMPNKRDHILSATPSYAGSVSPCAALRAIESALTRLPSDGYMRGVEDAAKVAEGYATCGCKGSRGRCMIDDAPLAIAEAIRKLGGAE